MFTDQLRLNKNIHLVIAEDHRILALNALEFISVSIDIGELHSKSKLNKHYLKNISL